MKNALQKITVTFVLICLIPVGFIVYQFSSLSDDEKIVTDIYRNQLDAILYSVNQYTDDVFNSWAGKIDLNLLKTNTNINDPESQEELSRRFAEMASVREIYLTDLKGKEVVLRLADSAIDKSVYESISRKIQDRLTRLQTYQRGGFRKIEAMDTLIAGQLIPVYFLLDEDAKDLRFAILLIDLNGFVQNVLAPKMQVISRGEFIISAYSRRDNQLIYSTEANHPSVSSEKVLEAEGDADVTKKELWLLPGYYIAITLKDATISDLVQQRVKTSMTIFAGLFLILVGGVIFLYYNIRREILLSQAKSEFVSNVSHEIRTPLSLISMYAETLEMDRVPESRKAEYYAIISREASRLAGIVNRILNFAQVDANKKKFDFKNIDLNDLCFRIAASYEPHMKERGFEFHFEADAGNLLVRADEESVSEAIHNLVDNAMKYSADEKFIRLRTGSDGVAAFAEVEDHGIGIPKVHQRNIFDQFYRVPSHNVHATKGTGLGLALVKRTMAAHKGKVKVFSTPGKGSTFVLYFPLHPTGIGATQPTN